ncbi:MAG: hypothetical protein Q8Q35_00555 [Nanoarchaeota archaeon]|nr:hypothetical protein [Nanoarchaeota archaeon]
MKSYYGGQIQEMYRGNQAIIVTSGECGFGATCHSPFSREFILKTGVAPERVGIERVYIGLSSESCKEVLNIINDIDNLNTLDRLLVNTILI